MQMVSLCCDRTLATVLHAKDVKFWLFHILVHKSSTIHCMAMLNIPYESLFLALQDEAPPVIRSASLPRYDFIKKTTIKNILGRELAQS